MICKFWIQNTVNLYLLFVGGGKWFSSLQLELNMNLKSRRTFVSLGFDQTWKIPI